MFTDIFCISVYGILSCGYFCAGKRAEKRRPDSAYEIMDSRVSEKSSEVKMKLLLNDSEQNYFTKW